LHIPSDQVARSKRFVEQQFHELSRLVIRTNCQQSQADNFQELRALVAGLVAVEGLRQFLK
jgi:hypothetical protein